MIGVPAKNCGCGNYQPKFIGLLNINWATGCCSLGFECQSCHKQGQVLQMLNLEGGLGELFKHEKCIEVKRG
jgi:hypothetical protein